MKKISIGIIGCGNISRAYVNGLSIFPFIEIKACASLHMATAEKLSKECDIPNAWSVEKLLYDPEIKVVVNLTPPQSHTSVNLQILKAGKHLYTEKPFALTRKDAAKVLNLAKTKGLKISCAPDTFMGGGQQTARKLIDDGNIGFPTAAVAFMCCAGHERWHPNPEFYYKSGGGPLLDMGPYYITSLVNLLGPVDKVCSMSKITFPERIIGNGKKKGNKISVETDTHISSQILFESGVIATLIMSFDVQSCNLPMIEIYGTKGTLIVPDPNIFKGPVKLRLIGKREKNVDPWNLIPIDSPYIDNVRGIGTAELIYSIENARPNRGSGELGYHVLDVMLSIIESAHTNKFISIKSKVTKPEPLKEGLLLGSLE